MNRIISKEHFPTGRSPHSVTRDISLKTIKLDELTMNFYDIPGVGDPELNFSSWQEMINEKLGKIKIHLLLYVINFQSCRVDMLDSIVLQSFCHFFECLNPENILFVFTKCDFDVISDEEAEKYIDTLRETCKIQSKFSNYLKFAKNNGDGIKKTSQGEILLKLKNLLNINSTIQIKKDANVEDIFMGSVEYFDKKIATKIIDQKKKMKN